MVSVLCVAILWVVNASSGEKSCLQFAIPTGSGAGGEGDVLHRLKNLKVFRAVETHQRSRGKVPTIGEKMKRGWLSVVKK